MPEIALYGRSDGLLEPRYDKGSDFVKERSGKLMVAKIDANVRTSLQNRYLWGWIYNKQICQKLSDAGVTLNDMPWTKDLLHAVFKEKFLVEGEIEFNGQILKVYESTASMGRKRFTEYVDEQIKPFVWGLWEISIDPPNEGYWREVFREISSENN